MCDPIEEIDPYLRISQETGMKIRYVIDTHVHADHVSRKPSSTIGFERRFNRALGIVEEQEFVSHMLQNIPSPPAEAAKITAINLGAEPA